MSDREVGKKEQFEVEGTEEKDKEEKNEGLILLFEEHQKGSYDHGGTIQSKKSQGKLYLKNWTGSAIYDFNLTLDGLEKTTLRETIDAPYLEETDGTGREFEYSLQNDESIVELTEEVAFEKSSGAPVVFFDTKNPVTFNFSIKSNTSEPITVELSKELPENIDISEFPRGENGELSTNGNITWKIPSLRSGEELKTSISAISSPESKKPFRSGKINYSVQGSGVIISGVKVDSLKAGGFEKIKETVEKDERIDEPGVWDVRLFVKNETKISVSPLAKVGLLRGDFIDGNEEGNLPGRVESPIPGKRSYPQLVLPSKELPAGEKIKIGEFPVKSEDEPELAAEIIYKFTPMVIKRVSGEFTVDDTLISCLSADLDKSIKVIHPPESKDLATTELLSNREEPVELYTKLKNTGSAEISSIKFHEIIPKGFTTPNEREIDVFFTAADERIQVPKSVVDVNVEPTTNDEESTLTVALRNLSEIFESLMSQNEAISLKYTVTSVNPHSDKPTKFPSTAFVSLPAIDRPLELKLEEPPTLTTSLTWKRKVRKEKQLSRGEGKHEFVVSAILTNEGSFPVNDYLFKDLVPENFDFLEEQATPPPNRTREVPEGIEVRWKLNEIPPQGKKTVEYIVRGRKNFQVSKLKELRY